MKKVVRSEWWKTAVFYQIYPRSFCDTNGDGIGDLPGVTGRLDDLKSLGVDAVWLSPVFESPQFDFGYDTSDYERIDSIFGTENEMDELIEAAHKRGIRVILDLAVNHTSHWHPWFRESRSSRDNPKSNWYLWHEGRGRTFRRPPNNWKSAFGGSGWEWDRVRGQYYFHSFLKEQPDLNWRNPEVKKAVFAAVKKWLDRGVDGFRLDVANCYFKDMDHRSNPFRRGPTPRPYDLQAHLYDRDRPETHDLLRELRILLDDYPGRMMVGEILAEKPGNPGLAASYLGNGENELHLAFDFSSLFARWDAKEFHRVITDWYNAMPPDNGWPAFFFNNHDNRRSITRYAKGRATESRARVLAALLLTLRGTPFLYYGEEIGMSNVRLRRKELQDPVGRKYWPFHSGRDGARTPMQWNTRPNAGFTDGQPWIRIPENARSVNLEMQEKDMSSLYHFYRDLIAIRKESPALLDGDWTSVKDGSAGVLAYGRKSGNQKIIVVLNFTGKPVKFHTEEHGNWKVLFSSQRPIQEEYISLNMTVHPYEVTLFEEVDLKR